MGDKEHETGKPNLVSFNSAMLVFVGHNEQFKQRNKMINPHQH
jgi:hypothetical protein